jgi:hypothetical protein
MDDALMDITIDPDRVVNEMANRIGAVMLENVKLSVAVVQLQEEIARLQAQSNGAPGAPGGITVVSSHDSPD